MMEQASIRQVPLFASLPDSEIEFLQAALHRAQFSAGEMLIYEGRRPRGWYLVLEGEVDILKSMGSVDEHLMAVRGPGATLGEMSLFSENHLPTASVRARTNLRVLRMRRQDLESLLHRQPELSFEMVRTLSRRLEQAENLTIRGLREKNQQLQLAYDELKAAQDQLAEKERMERELEVARDIQLSILPQSLPEIDKFKFGARIYPASEVGGDFFDVIELDDGTFGIAVGDVTGHGVPAALLMALTATLLRVESPRSQTPAAALRAVNHWLLEMSRTGRFVTLLYGVLHASTGEFSFARAGHSMPMVVEPGGRLIDLEPGVGQPLGLFENLEIHEGHLQLSPGSLLLIYTDGVTEAVDSSGEFFEEHRLFEIVRTCKESSPSELCDAIWEAVEAYQDGVEREDDVTLLAVRSKMIEAGDVGIG